MIEQLFVNIGIAVLTGLVASMGTISGLKVHVSYLKEMIEREREAREQDILSLHERINKLK